MGRLVITLMAYQLIERYSEARKVVKDSKLTISTNRDADGDNVPFQLISDFRVERRVDRGCRIGFSGARGSHQIGIIELTLSVVRLLIQRTTKRGEVVLFDVVIITTMRYVSLEDNEVVSTKVIIGLLLCPVDISLTPEDLLKHQNDNCKMRTLKWGL